MKRVFNFSAGPATLPHEVFLEAQQEMLDWHGTGLSVMEMSHRGKAFMEIIHDAEKDLRHLLNIPPNYKVLFTQGGASLQFAMVPLNLIGDYQSIDCLDIGHWSKMAIKEAKHYAKVNVVASGDTSHYLNVPDQSSWQFDPNAAYFHYTSNETIGGLQLHSIPSQVPSDVPLVCDMSSDFLSKPLDVSKFGLIYAGAQKNIGPAGLVVVIIREDLLDRVKRNVPTMLNYSVLAAADSMYNTPATYSIYIAGLVFKWLKKQDGLDNMARINRQKSDLLYQAIENSQGFYTAPVMPEYRSEMNVVFKTPSEALDNLFVTEAEDQGLVQLKGHRVLGGLRASIYNAMPIDGVKALIQFMQQFKERNA